MRGPITASECKQSLKQSDDEFHAQLGTAELYEKIFNKWIMTDPKFLEANAAKLAKMAMTGCFPDTLENAKKPMFETDWHAEAQMYSECLGKVKDFCDIPKDHHRSMRERYLRPNDICECCECTLKRRIQRIIADNLK